MDVNLDKLRELGFILPEEEVLSVEPVDLKDLKHDSGGWYRTGEHFVCPLDISTASGVKRVWLKAFYDSFGPSIEHTVNNRVEYAKRVIEAGGHIPKTELYSPGTMAQSHVEGISYPSAQRTLTPEELSTVEANIRNEFEIYDGVGLVFCDGGYNVSRDLGGIRGLHNFIVTPDLTAYLVDPHFNPKRE